MVVLAVREGVLSKDVARIMQNVLKFPDKKVVHIMTPDTVMAMVASKKSLKMFWIMLLKPNIQFIRHLKNQEITLLVTSISMIFCPISKIKKSM